MKRLVVICLATIVALMMAGLARADETQKAEGLVKEAVGFYKANDIEKALEEYSNPAGKFKQGDIYVFVYDLEGTMLAHPNNTLIGQNLLEVPDAGGKMFRKEIVQGAKTKGSGWVDYQYLNPKTKEVEQKTTYFEKVDDLVICCGIYRK
ncbi:MAG TPA: cache domain-containing protein [Geobacteraceae bacterium]|nr:cache domain-containing protein [Geobacteraceae bacterium]